MQKVTPFLWFDTQAEEAATFYTSIFKNSKITHVSRYDAESAKVSGQQEGTAMVVAFELDGQQFSAINGGPQFKFSEAVSFVINCENQEEIDHYWNSLSADPASEQCGWLKDKYGLSWQVVPTSLGELMSDPNTSPKVMQALLQMKKIIIADLEKAKNDN